MSYCKISSPAELVASVPAILGFHPTLSLVSLWTDARAELVWSIRFDLDTPEPMMARTLMELIDRDDRQGPLNANGAGPSHDDLRVSRRRPRRT